MRTIRGCALAALGILAACDEDQIVRYRLKKLPPPEPPEARRMLAAIVPAAEYTWFFKAAGPDSDVVRLKPQFEEFLKTLRVSGRTLTWSIPQGWTERPAPGMRFAVFRVGGPERPLEVSVTRLGRQAGSMLDNVNRWRGQMGLVPISAEKMAQVTSVVNAGELSATVFDIAQEAHAPVERESYSPRFFATVPEGWKDMGPKGMRLATYSIGEGGEVSVTALDGNGGGLPANINRWRAQIGLGELSEPEIAALVGKTRAAGSEASIVDLSGPRGRIVGAILERGARTWFFKMQGPGELIGREQAAFTSFLESVKIDH